jgi:Phage integrase family
VAIEPATAGEGLPAGGAGLVPQAASDAQLLALWLFGRSPHTQRAYRREATRFLAHPTLAGKPLRQVTLGDVQACASALADPAAPLGLPSQARVLLPASVWADLQALGPTGDTAPDAPVFRSREGGHLTARQAQRLVDAAARRAGLRAGVSPHWLRHAHATHALERGAPIHIVQATLGHASVATTGRYLHARPTDSSARYLAV